MSAFLNRRVLVLNQSYEPIMVIGAKRAIILILCEKVDALENYRELIHSAYLTLPLPSVIKLKQYARIRRKGIVLSRRNILKKELAGNLRPKVMSLRQFVSTSRHRCKLDPLDSSTSVTSTADGYT